MGHAMTKPVFEISKKVIFKPVCSASETSSKINIMLVASLDIMLLISE